MDAAGEITVSVGIAQGPENAGNPRDLVDCAESAMMAAKARGKNRIVVYAGDIAERPGAHDAARDVRSVAHLKMLQSVAARLNRLNSVKDIAEAIVSELRGLIDYHSCRVYLVDGDEVFPVAVKGDGVTEEEQVQALRIEIGTGVTGHVAETGRPVLAANALDCEFAIQIPGTEEVDESVIAVPLRYGARVTGVVFLSKLGVGQFDESDLRLLEVLAGYASVSLENARLYESLRLEADHAKAWLEFADAISDAESAEQIAEETAKATAAILDCEVVSLWLEDPRSGDFTCLACCGLPRQPLEAMCDTRLPRIAGEAFMEVSSSPRRVEIEELAELFRSPEMAAVGPVAVAPLPAGHGVRGWLMVGKPTSSERGLTDERLRLLEGLSYRAAMALQKARLARHREQSIHVADALLEYARALARDEGDDVEERIVRLAAEMLDASEVSLWLQAEPGAELAAVAAWDDDEDHRALVLADQLPGRGRAAVLGATGALRAPSRAVRGDPRRDGAQPRRRRRGGAVHARPGSNGLPRGRCSRGRDVRRASAEDARRPRRPGDARARLAEQRHDVRAELVEEAALVLARRVEHEVREAEVRVRRDLGGNLLGIGGDDEPRVSPVGRGVGEALHLDGVLHAHLLFGRERERRPPAARVARVVRVVVVRDLDLDHADDRRGVAAGRFGALLDGIE